MYWVLCMYTVQVRRQNFFGSVCAPTCHSSFVVRMCSDDPHINVVELYSVALAMKPNAKVLQMCLHLVALV